jgi:hypothetical protein
MAATHYNSTSKGPVEIASMHHAHALNARDALARKADPARQDELDALNAHIASLEDEQTVEGRVHGRMMPDDASQHRPAGAQQSRRRPTPSRQSASTAKTSTWRPSHWLDGAEITSDAEAEAVTRLLNAARDAESAADAQRVEENRPFDLGKAAVQAKFAPLIGSTPSPARARWCGCRRPARRS